MRKARHRGMRAGPEETIATVQTDRAINVLGQGHLWAHVFRAPVSLPAY